MPGTAWNTVKWLRAAAVPGIPLQPVLAGRYHDTFTRADGDWWFTERMVRPDLEGDLSRHMGNRG